MTAPRVGSLHDGPAPDAPGVETCTDLLRAGGVRVERIASRAVQQLPVASDQDRIRLRVTRPRHPDQTAQRQSALRLVFRF